MWHDLLISIIMQNVTYTFSNTSFECFCINYIRIIMLFRKLIPPRTLTASNYAGPAKFAKRSYNKVDWPSYSLFLPTNRNKTTALHMRQIRPLPHRFAAEYCGPTSPVVHMDFFDPAYYGALVMFWNEFNIVFILSFARDVSHYKGCKVYMAMWKSQSHLDLEAVQGRP